jgi:hypothetical protein
MFPAGMSVLIRIWGARSISELTWDLERIGRRRNMRVLRDGRRNNASYYFQPGLESVGSRGRRSMMRRLESNYFVLPRSNRSGSPINCALLSCAWLRFTADRTSSLEDRVVFPPFAFKYLLLITDGTNHQALQYEIACNSDLCRCG